MKRMKLNCEFQFNAVNLVQAGGSAVQEARSQCPLDCTGQLGDAMKTSQGIVSKKT